MANTIRDASGLKYVEMSAGRFARMPLADLFDGGSWTTIRVALFLNVEDSGADITGTPSWFVGLCSGTTNIPGDATPTNAIGIRQNSATIARNTSAGNQRYYFFNVVASKIVAGTTTDGGSFTANAQMRLTTNTNGGDGTPWFIDITKGSPNFSLTAFVPNQITNTPVMTYAQYRTQSISTTPAWTNVAYSGPQALAFSEGGGTLDSAFVWWSPSVPAMRILEWRVIRIA